ncbi:MAG: RNA polymerase sigma factor [Lachnospiraceae bacterium]|nr:RNA polymerase sigma factor [Lachnospiraceae bacterium]
MLDTKGLSYPKKGIRADTGISSMDEKALIRKLKKGDSESLNRIFDAYYDKVYGYCYRHLNHRENAQDMTQEVFLRVCRNISDYRHYGKFENYLYVIAANLLKDHYRKKQLLPLEDIVIKETEPGFARAENTLIVTEALRKLPEQEREIIVLRYYQELKIKDIARILDLKLSTTKYHLKRAQEMLGELLEENEDHTGNIKRKGV